jgi:hypothetical protein
MTCRACEEARRAALAFYDRLAAAIRIRETPAPPVPPKAGDPGKYHDRPWAGVPKEEKP